MINKQPPRKAVLAGGAALIALAAVTGVWFLSRGDGGGTATPGVPAATSTTTPEATASASRAASASSPAKPLGPVKPSGPAKSPVQAKPSGQAKSSVQAKPSSQPQPSGSASESAKAAPRPRPGRPTTVGTGKTEPVEPVKTQEPVALDDTGDFGTGLTVKLREIKAVKGEATVPGEIAGPAVRINLEAENGSKAAVSLDQVVVFVSYGKDRTPAIELSKGARRLSGELDSGDSKAGTYIYTVPQQERKSIRVEISYSGQAPTVAFEGSV